MTKQDEKQRLKRRLQEYAIYLASNNRWQEAVDVNAQILQLGEEAETYNRLGKAYKEQGFYSKAHDAYEQTLRINPTNAIARKNLNTIEVLQAHGLDESEPIISPPQVDMRLFINEAGKTVLTNLQDVPHSIAVESASTGQKVELQIDDQKLLAFNAHGHLLGTIEPRLGQRLIELIKGGNRYTATIAQSDPRHIRLLIRESYQDPSQLGRVSFPAKISDATMGYMQSMRYDYGEVSELMEEEEDTIEESEDSEEDFTTSDDDEELGLEEIEKDISGDEEIEE